MDEEIGPIMYFDNTKDVYIPYKTYSEKTAEKIDNKIKEYMNTCYKESKKIITKNKLLMDKMSKILLKKEYLTREEFNLLMENKPIKTTKSTKKTNIKTKNKPIKRTTNKKTTKTKNIK